jgi:hypothetical protein
MKIDFLFLSQFLGSWSGDKLYSHSNETFVDTCLRLKISEVNLVSAGRVRDIKETGN